MWISKDIHPSKSYRTIPPWLQNPTLMLLAHEWNGISNPFSKCLSQLQQKKIASSISFWPLNLSFANTILFRWNQMHQVKAVLIILYKTLLLFTKLTQWIIAHRWSESYMTAFLKAPPILIWFFSFYLIKLQLHLSY